ncbi:SRPBCC family protein [Lentzea sp. NPDC051208]|uniref:SRPBCC family protein n=1 Tax=Lentzea sp. NPDC051208 TaxID=3154642 RepID=UPI003448FFA0
MEFKMAQSFEDSARNLWRTISDFGGVSRYCPSVIRSVAEGTELGSLRTLTVRRSNGTSFSYQERLEGIDQEHMYLTYSMPDASHSPFEDGYRATMHVTELGDNRCLLTWSAEAEPRDCSADEMTAFLRVAYQSVFEALRTLHP